MKFNDLKNRVAALNDNWNLGIQVRKYSDKTVIRTFFGGDEDTADLFFYEISEQRLGSFVELKDTLLLSAFRRLALQKLAYKYSRAPLDEREDEPKFRVRMMPSLPNQNGDLYYVNYSLKNSEINVGPDVDMSDDPLFRSKCHFTKKEYVSIQREFPEWLPKFDKNDPHFEIVEGEDG